MQEIRFGRAFDQCRERHTLRREITVKMLSNTVFDTKQQCRQFQDPRSVRKSWEIVVSRTAKP